MNAAKSIALMLHRAALRIALRRRWAPAAPATLAAAIALQMTGILRDHATPLAELERAIWALAASLTAATVLWTLSGQYQKNPLCRACGADKTECWGNLKRHHSRPGKDPEEREP